MPQFLRMNFINALAFRFPEFLLSGTAIIIYIIVIVAAIFVLAFIFAGTNSKAATKSEKMEDTQISVVPKSSEGEEKERFSRLKELDSERKRYEGKKYEKGIRLEEFCEGFRNYAANELKLYYSKEDIRRFVAGLGVSKMMIVQGMSGTGKTSLAHAMGSFLDNPSVVIPVQPVWKERSDLIGYYNEFTKKFNETQLLEKMYEANYSKDMYITILDEMNIARVEYYFAEFLSLLELPDAEERYLDVVSDKWENDPIQLRDGRIKMPDNMWFIGTANNDDSTFAISDKVYDRAMILELEKKGEKFSAPKSGKMRISAEEFEKMVSVAMREYEVSGRNMRRLRELDEYLTEHYHITFGNRIMNQILRYVPIYIGCGGRELEAFDDILSKKVMRKLELQNPIYFRNTADELVSYIEELFGEGEMRLCRERIEKIRRNA